MREFINLVETHLNEAGAGPARLMAHIRNGTPFFMISACRGDLSPELNKKRTALLKSQLAGLPGLSFVEVDGRYHEDGQDEPTNEDSFFVMPRSEKTNVDKFLVVGQKLMKVFGQDAIVSGNGTEVKLQFSNGSDEDIGSIATFDWGAVKHMPGHSAIQGRAFGFTSRDKAPNGLQYGVDRDKEERAYC